MTSKARSDLLTALADVDTKARDFARAFATADALLIAERKLAIKRGDHTQGVADALDPSRWRDDVARHLAALGLGPILADAARAARAGWPPGVPADSFVSRWTKTIQQWVA